MADMIDGCSNDIPDSMEENTDDSWTDDEIENNDLCNSQQVECIFTDLQFSDAKEYFHYLKEKYDFDIWNLVHVDLKLDFFGYVKLINFLRTNFRDCSPPSVEKLEDLRDIWQDEKYLKPALSDDLLLQFMIDEENDIGGDSAVGDDSIVCKSLKNDSNDKTEFNMSNDKLIQKLQEYETKTQMLESQLKRAYSKIDKMKEFMNDVILTSDMYRPVAACRRKLNNLEDEEFEDSGYYGSYSHHDIHAEMLQDKVRTLAYQNAILSNPDAFRNKVVLDVGCGTGILSMFAAKAGAKHVYGVDMADIAYQAMDIVKENSLDDKITIIKGCIEEVELPVQHVDIIISEWMGYFLLYESMLDSVLLAADKWLIKNGLILPDQCSVSLVAIHDENLLKSQVKFWDDVYGFRMSCLKKSAASEAVIQVIPGKAVISDPVRVAEFNMQRVAADQLNYKSDFSIKILKSGVCSAIGAYFDVDFINGLTHQGSFSTGPFSSPTHWKQTILFLEKVIVVMEGDMISGHIDCHKNPQDPRSLIIQLSLADIRQTYTLS